ncbi:hypothetical protein B0J17DRAFT_633988 [Rhizoctonia solani]|nr:hypothetical protein B0J17DRAFT_633988 [Rhizoctonia solani]
MATSTNSESNALKAPALTQTNLRRRPIRAATELIAKSAANIVDVPGLKDSVQAARGVFMALKEPARNDLVAQNLIDYLDEILLCAHKDNTEEACSEHLEYLQQVKAAIVELKNTKYRTKLACQREIGKELAKRKDEIFERALLFSVEGRVYGRRVDARSTELEERCEHLSESLAELRGELNAVKLQLAQQAESQLHRCALFGNTFDLNFKVFFFKHERIHVAVLIEQPEIGPSPHYG